MAPKRASRIMRLQKPNSKRDDFDSTYVRHFIYFDAKHAMDFVRALLIITRLCLGCQSVLIWNAILFKWNQYKINALQHDFRSRTLFINNFLPLVFIYMLLFDIIYNALCAIGFLTYVVYKLCVLYCCFWKAAFFISLSRRAYACFCILIYSYKYVASYN